MGRNQTQQQKQTAPAEELKVETVLVELPRAPHQEGRYLQTHVEVGRLSQEEAKALKRIRDGCELSGATLANGRRVITAPDAIRYLLQQAGEAQS